MVLNIYNSTHDSIKQAEPQIIPNDSYIKQDGALLNR